jgi:hypothetical protein
VSNNETLPNTPQYQDAVQEYFNSAQFILSDFLNNPEDWPNAILSVTKNYLIILTFAESDQIFNYEHILPPPDYFEFHQDYWNYQYMSDDAWRATILLEKRLRALNISVNEVRQALGTALKAKFQMSIDFYKLVSGTIVQHPIKDEIDTSWIDWWWTCYNVDFEHLGITFASNRDYVQITLNATEQPFRAKIYKYVSF